MNKKSIYGNIFDGVEMLGYGSLEISDDIIENIFIECEFDGSKHIIMPGFIDAHTHAYNKKHIKEMYKNGVNANFSVQAREDITSLNEVKTFTSYTMALGKVKDGCAFVEGVLEEGGDYLKIIIEEKPRMSRTIITRDVMSEIIDCGHEHGLKTVIHATTVKDINTAVDLGCDIVAYST